MNKYLNKQKLHDFHLVLRNDLKNKIANLAFEMGSGISEASSYILEKTLCILNKYNFEKEEVDEISKYQNIDWDEDMHIYMDEILYRRIKHLSDTMFAFSIAIVIRKLFDFYFYILEMSNGNKDRVEKVFKRFYLIHVKKYGNDKTIWKKSLKQKQLYGEFFCFLELNDKFSITGFNFINTT